MYGTIGGPWEWDGPKASEVGLKVSCAMVVGRSIVVKYGSDLMCNIELEEDPAQQLKSPNDDLDMGVNVDMLLEGGESEEGIEGSFGGVVSEGVGCGGAKMG